MPPESHLKILNLITSAKTLFPNKATFTGFYGFGRGHVLGSHHSTHCWTNLSPFCYLVSKKPSTCFMALSGHLLKGNLMHPTRHVLRAASLLLFHPCHVDQNVFGKLITLCLADYTFTNICFSKLVSLFSVNCQLVHLLETNISQMILSFADTLSNISTVRTPFPSTHSRLKPRPYILWSPEFITPSFLIL